MYIKRIDTKTQPKNMKCTNSFVIMPFFLVPSIADAQTKTITIGPQLDIPANFGKASKLGLGASAEGVFNFNESSAFRVYAGYSAFKGKFFGETLAGLSVSQDT